MWGGGRIWYSPRAGQDEPILHTSTFKTAQQRPLQISKIHRKITGLSDKNLVHVYSRSRQTAALLAVAWEGVRARPTLLAALILNLFFFFNSI